MVAIIEGEEPRIIPNAEGKSKTPSVVAFMEDGEVVVGEIARRQSATQPRRTISSAKRLLGQLKEELDEAGEIYPFEIGENEDGQATIIVGDKSYSPGQISALILDKLKVAAEDYVGGPIKKAIITVPAYFDDVQRQATLEAARIAGLEVLRLINEPTAAAMAYGLDRDREEIVAIYDFGGGTFDFSILDIDGKTFEVLATTGDSRLGGDDLDMALVDLVAEEFLEKESVDLRDDFLTLRRLKDEMERVKCELSTSNTSALNLPFITYSDGNPLHLERTITREEFEDILEPFVEDTLRSCSKGLQESGLKKSRIGKVILVGGSTRIPLVQEMVEEFFGMAPFKGVNPDEVVAIGAAMQGAVLEGHLDEVILLDITPHDLSIEVKGDRGSVLVEKNSTIPIKVERTFTTTEDGQSFVNVHLLQGESDKASENRSLGKFTLSGIPESEAGVPRIRVEIFVNADGVVEVSAMETHTGQEKRLTSIFASLNADERRARQRPTRKRRSRRRRKKDESQARQKILDGSPVPAAHDTELPQTDAAMPEMFSGVGVPTPCPDQPAAPAQEIEPGRLKSALEAVAAKSQTPLPSGESRRDPAASPIEAVTNADTKAKRGSAGNEPDASAQAPVVSAAETAKAPSSGGAPASHEPSAVQSSESGAESASDREYPEALRATVDLIRRNANNAESHAIYDRDRDEFLAFCAQFEEAFDVHELKARYFILSKQPEEARDALVTMLEVFSDNALRTLELYGMLCRTFPNYIAARSDRAALAYELGDLKISMMDLEFVAKREDVSASVFDRLGRIYSAMLEENPEATVRFKLVKLHLRQGDIDEAIGLLQHMVQVPEYKDRSNKVLGLCFWQKGLRYLALQKFKTIALNDEMKDILFRLSEDMEKNDELLHAKYALEYIYESDISYLDVGERLKKLTCRLDVMKDQRYNSPFSGDIDATIAENSGLMGNRFEIINEINRGSMGIVYKALDHTLDEIVALKVLNDFLCTDPDAVVRFKREARSARRLSHHGIVRIHDFMELDGKKLISMEYIEGEDMKTILARNSTFTEDMITYYLTQICSAIAHAHSYGIVHRDIKPANIMIDERNKVKITDFGIAKVIDGGATNNGTMVMGTPLYMSPEQIQGGKIDPRADIYALGIMLYEFVIGSPPFYEGSIEYQHLHTPLPEITCGVSNRLITIIRKCTQKDPDDRYQSMGEILEVLEVPEDGSAAGVG